MIKKLMSVCLFVLLAAVFVFNFSAIENKNIILGTTTSVQDTGLLDVLISKFQEVSGLIVKPIAVGTGQAIQMGKNGEADILWVHSPDDEIQFVNEGYGTDRTTFMHNDFVVVGPKNDPAKIRGIKKAADAFKNIASAKALFVSRGDKSGTHKKELKLWKEAGVTLDASFYIEAGQGMAATAGVAEEKQAYCLIDRSTYLSLAKSLSLEILCEGDGSLLNRYSLILVNPALPGIEAVQERKGGVNPEKFPKVNAEGAKKLFDFLLSNETKDIVENFGKEKFGKQIFFWEYVQR